MHSVLTRTQNVFGYFTSVASVVAIAIAAFSLLTTPVPRIAEGGLVMKNVQVVKGRPHYYSPKREEYAHVKFDLDVDLSTLFTWNTKQIFLYITASYPPTHFNAPPNTSNSTSTSTSTKRRPSSPPNLSHAPPSHAIIWDAILPHPLSPAHHNQYVGNSGSRRNPGGARGSSWDKQRPGILRLQGQKPKYQITDPSGEMAGRANATLEVGWNVQPWVGALTWGVARARPELGTAGSSGTGLRGMLAGLTWKTVPGARTGVFGFPGLKERGEAAAAAGRDGLGTEKGKEKNRLEVG